MIIEMGVNGLIIRVSNRCGQPVEGAIVLVGNKKFFQKSVKNKKKAFTTATTTKGYVHIPESMVGEYMIRVRRVPYLPFEEIIDIDMWQNHYDVILHLDGGWESDPEYGWMYPVSLDDIRKDLKKEQEVMNL